MTSNRRELESLWDANAIPVRRGDIFQQVPSALPSSFRFDRIEGMMLGLAVGDALGNPSESKLPDKRMQLFGEISNYKDGVGRPSDDSQLAFWTLEQLLEDRCLQPQRVAQRFRQDHIYGIGKTVREAFAAMDRGATWRSSGQPSAGNGALMRIAPVVIPYLCSPSEELWADAALCTYITHNDSMAVSSAIAFVALLWDLLGTEEPPAAMWWPRQFTAVLRDLEDGQAYSARSPPVASFRGPLSRFLETELDLAWREGWTVRQACDRWHSGAFLLETVPCVLYILMRLGHQPEEALVRAVNDTKDNDTIAAIVGAALGALHGKDALPPAWIAGLSGRTRQSDDGRMFELLRQARALWGPA